MVAKTCHWQKIKLISMFCTLALYAEKTILRHCRRRQTYTRANCYPFSAFLHQTSVIGWTARGGDLPIWLLASTLRSRKNTCVKNSWSDAETSSRRLLDIDPFREVGHRFLMQALDGAGRRAEALQQFHSLSGLLRDEMGIRPDLDTGYAVQGVSATSHQHRLSGNAAK